MMKHRSATILVILVLIFGIVCWASNSSGKAKPPTTETLSSAEKAEAVEFLKSALAASQEKSSYTGKRKFTNLVADPRARKTNEETFRLLRNVHIADNAQLEAVRMRQSGEIGLLFNDLRGARISVVLHKTGTQFKVARAGTI